MGFSHGMFSHVFQMPYLFIRISFVFRVMSQNHEPQNQADTEGKMTSEMW